MDSDNKAGGCLKTIGIGAAIILVIFVIGGALDGIHNLFSQMPWYVIVFLSIGFIYIMYKIGDN